VLTCPPLQDAGDGRFSDILDKMIMDLWARIGEGFGNCFFASGDD